jgi:hypothetical protein
MYGLGWLHGTIDFKNVILDGRFGSLADIAGASAKVC